MQSSSPNYGKGGKRIAFLMRFCSLKNENKNEMKLRIKMSTRWSGLIETMYGEFPLEDIPENIKKYKSLFEAIEKTETIEELIKALNNFTENDRNYLNCKELDIIVSSVTNIGEVVNFTTDINLVIFLIERLKKSVINSIINGNFHKHIATFSKAVEEGFTNSVRKGNIEFVEYFYPMMNPSIIIKNIQQFMVYAVKSDNVEIVKKFKGAIVFNKTILENAILSQNIDILKYIAEKYDENVMTFSIETAVRYKNYKAIEFFIEKYKYTQKEIYEIFRNKLLDKNIIKIYVEKYNTTDYLVNNMLHESIMLKDVEFIEFCLMREILPPLHNVANIINGKDEKLIQLIIKYAKPFILLNISDILKYSTNFDFGLTLLKFSLISENDLLNEAIKYNEENVIINKLHVATEKHMLTASIYGNLFAVQKLYEKNLYTFLAFLEASDRNHGKIVEFFIEKGKIPSKDMFFVALKNKNYEVCDIFLKKVEYEESFIELAVKYSGFTTFIGKRYLESFLGTEKSKKMKSENI